MTGQAYPAVRPDDVAAYPLSLPPLAEQRAIAAVLDAIDEAIERTGEVIASTERLRDALLHELLTRGLPGRHSEWADVPGLGTVPACWDVVRLEDILVVDQPGAWGDGPTPGRPGGASPPRGRPYPRRTSRSGVGRVEAALGEGPRAETDAGR